MVSDFEETGSQRDEGDRDEGPEVIEGLCDVNEYEQSRGYEYGDDILAPWMRRTGASFERRLDESPEEAFFGESGEDGEDGSDVEGGCVESGHFRDGKSGDWCEQGREYCDDGENEAGTERNRGVKRG